MSEAFFVRDIAACLKKPGTSLFGGDTIRTFLTFLLFGAGLILIIRGGDRFVGAAARIAEISGVPPFVIGATIVSVATTLPELIVSVMAAAEGQPDMAAGNAIGSVTANTALILGVSVLIAPAAAGRGFIRRSLILFTAVILLWLFSIGGSLGVVGSAVMLALFCCYIFETLRDAKKLSPGPTAGSGRGEGLKNALGFVLGAAAIIIGSRMLVDNGTVIAREILHADERIISLTLLAVGTSLPELVTAISAIAKGHSSLTAGNILGANIIDTLLILPLCSLISGGLPVGKGTLTADLPVCFVCSVIILLPAMIGRRFFRLQGFVVLLLYLLYIIKIVFSIVI